MGRAAAAEGDQRESARVEAALDRDRPNRARHVGIDHRAHAERRVRHREPERARQRAPDRLFSERRIEGQRAAGKRGRIEIAQHQVGIGHRRLLAGLPVAGGAGLGPGRIRGRP